MFKFKNKELGQLVKFLRISKQRLHKDVNEEIVSESIFDLAHVDLKLPYLFLKISFYL